MPFDRLVMAVDRWAAAHGRNDVFAQIGQSRYTPSGMQWAKLLPPEEFRRKYEAAELIVAHAGTGSIITALQLGKPILVMPRRAALRETRNDHQVATADRFRRLRSVAVAWDENELEAKLSRMEELGPGDYVGPYASRTLVDTLREFFSGAEVNASLP